MKPITTFLSINRTVLGAYRAAWMFKACRHAAQRLDPCCQPRAVYDAEHERIGWSFTMKDQMAVTRLHLCHSALMQGRGLPELLP